MVRGGPGMTGAISQTRTETDAPIAPSEVGLTASDAERLLSGHHDDPFAILGPHVHDGGTVVRAFDPGAARLAVIADR